MQFVCDILFLENVQEKMRGKNPLKPKCHTASQVIRIGTKKVA